MCSWLCRYIDLCACTVRVHVFMAVWTCGHACHAACDSCAGQEERERGSEIQSKNCSMWQLCWPARERERQRNVYTCSERVKSGLTQCFLQRKRKLKHIPSRYSQQQEVMQRKCYTMPMSVLPQTRKRQSTSMHKMLAHSEFFTYHCVLHF